MTEAASPPEDASLLRESVEHQAGDAAAQLVRRHVAAVYSSAVRRAMAADTLGVNDGAAQKRLTQAATVSDESMRRATSGPLLQSWRARKPQAAARWESRHPSLTPN